jgi:hypothetical protein
MEVAEEIHPFDREPKSYRPTRASRGIQRDPGGPDGS